MKSVLKNIFELLPSTVQHKISKTLKDNQRKSLKRRKENIVREYQRTSQYKIFVETGTFKGDMIEAQRNNFDLLFSIELGQELWQYSFDRFKGIDNIKIMQGDSGKVLKDITRHLDKPAIFWLDGHYSEGITAKGDTECPIFGELDAIFQFKQLNHIILIDDARCFTGDHDWPTIDQVTEYVRRLDSSYRSEVKDDVIRLTK